MRKIDIYNNGKYVCTTTRSKTCKQAVERFQAKPWYHGMRKDGTFGDIILLDASKITARFQ